MYRSRIEHYEEVFGYRLPKNLGAEKLPIFDHFVKGGSIPSTPLNGSLQNFNTWRILVGSSKLRRDILGIGPNKIWEPRIYIFSTTSQLNSNFEANISGEEPDRDNRERALETTVGSLHRAKISWTMAHYRRKVGPSFLGPLPRRNLGPQNYLFSTTSLKENRVIWCLWTNFYETVTHDVRRSAIKHCE